MTFEEACKALGYESPLEWMGDDSREALISTAEQFSENGKKPISSGDAGRVRAEIEMFG